MLKIVLTGPESTGKTTLAEQLATAFEVEWLPEFAREYIGNLERPYIFEDLKKIAKGQIDAEVQFLAEAKKQQSELIFFDTDLITIKIWSDDKFGKTEEWILNQIQNRSYDFYLLCKPDLDWEFDPQREDANRLNELFEIYKKELIALKKPFAIIEGQGSQRLEKAMKTILIF